MSERTLPFAGDVCIQHWHTKPAVARSAGNKARQASGRVSVGRRPLKFPTRASTQSLWNTRPTRTFCGATASVLPDKTSAAPRCDGRSKLGSHILGTPYALMDCWEVISNTRTDDAIRCGLLVQPCTCNTRTVLVESIAASCFSQSRGIPLCCAQSKLLLLAFRA